MSNLYPDLENKFPEQIDDFEKFQDPNLTSISLINEYYSYFDSGNLQAANELLENNPSLKRMIINAESLNKLRDAILSVQRYYLNDVESYLVNIVKFKGDFNNLSKYTKYDVVGYVNESAIQYYMAKMHNIPIGTLPTNTDYFVPLTLRGQQGVSGTGLSPRGLWGNIVQYYENDCVSYNNSLWSAKQVNVGQPPQDGSEYWELLMKLENKTIVSNTEPLGLTAGDWWFHEKNIL